nr:tripartite motif-containing protein 65-like isoform X2 [Malus domestica]
MARKEEEPKQSPINPKNQQREPDPVEVEISGTSGNAIIFSPRFKSVAAMAGWDEESLLVASLVVDDTPERDFKHKKRSVLNSKTPPTNSSRRAPRRSPISIPVAVLDLDDAEETAKDEGGKEKKVELEIFANKDKETREDKMAESSGGSCPPSSNLPCLDKLREELSCAICLEICFEPSTTPCGHSFCKKCLRSAADKCGKRCPKCRQLISNSRSCTVNTVLWNTIQLLFPQEVEARKAVGASNGRETDRQSPGKAVYNARNAQSRRASGVSSTSSSREMTMRRRRVILSQDEEDEAEHRNQEQTADRSIRFLRASSREMYLRSSSRRISSQDEDAALVLRLQREEFMEAFRGTPDQSSSSLISSARANMRALASRATNHRLTRHKL